MKRLLVLTPASVGSSTAVTAPTFWYTMNKFVERGWVIQIVCANDRLTERCTEDTTNPGVRIFRCRIPLRKLMNKRIIWRIASYIQCPFYNRTFFRMGERLIRENGYTPEDTVIYADDAYAIHAGKRLSRKYGMKLVTRFCGTTMCGKKNTFLNRLHFYPHLQALGTKADLVIMTDDGTKGDEVLKEVKNQSPKQVFWRNGVNFAPKSAERPALLAALPENERILMTLCRLQDWKHVDRAISALGVLHEKYPNTTLVVCGYGPERENLETQTKELGLADKVIFTGSIPHEETGNYLSNADIFLSMYDLSNLGNPIFEAMRCARPIVTINVGATNTVIENEVNGLLLPPDHLEERIPAAIDRLFSDPELMKRISEGAKAFADKNFWTWDERTSAEEKAISELLEQAQKEAKR